MLVFRPHSLFARLALAVVFLSSLSTVTTAAPTFYFGATSALIDPFTARNLFLADLSLYGVDDIESHGAFTPDPTLTFPSTGLTAATDVNFVAPFGAVSGSLTLFDQGPGISTDPNIPDTFTFNKLLTGFGFYATNVADGANANSLSLILENTLLPTSQTVSLGTFGPGANPTDIYFFGVTDTVPFNKVTLVETFDFDGLLLDDVTAGYIPEPSTYALLAGAAIVGAVVLRRRK